MSRNWRFIAAALVSAMLMSVSAAMALDAPRISKEKTRSLLEDPNVIILDARTGGSWSESDSKIKGAVRVDPADVGSWAGKMPKNKKIIVYCS